MTITTTDPGLMPVGRPSPDRPRLDALAELSTPELRRLFLTAPEPTAADLTALHGDQILRGFAPVGGRAASVVLRRPTFFWIGKSFRPSATDPELLAGHNFFRVLGGSRALPFVADIAPSVVDGRRTVRIDYGHRDLGSTGLRRGLYDEIRMIDDGLWLGPGFIRFRRRRVLLCHFALDTQIPSSSTQPGAAR